jgi:nucleoside-diphosphate-sugar epimerase
MKVFVTGATGLIGAGAVRALVAAGHEVTGLTSREAGRAAIERAGASAIVGDMRDPSAYRKAAGEANAVVHTAAAFPDKIRWSKADVDAFARGDADAVDALVSVVGPSCRAFVASSGAYAYGDTGAEPAAETRSTDRHHAMMDIRLQTEAKVLELARLGKVPGMVARPGLVYGDGSMWAKLYLGPMRKGRRAMLPGDGKNLISFVHADDCGEAYRTIVEHGRPGEIYNIGDDAPAPLGDVLRAQAKAIGAPPPRPFPSWLIRLVAGPYASTPALATTVIDSTKLRELGWTLRYPRYQEGVVALARSFEAKPSALAS